MWRSRESTSLLAMWPGLLGFTGVDVVYVRLARMTVSLKQSGRTAGEAPEWDKKELVSSENGNRNDC